MPISLATRQIIVERMDKQFNEDLRMRKDTNGVAKELITTNFGWNNLKFFRLFIELWNWRTHSYDTYNS